jgi:hypothetical protein
MTPRRIATVVLGFALALALPALVRGVDVWDASGSDGNSGTDNELTHGTEQVHDLQQVGGVADQDWYLVAQQPYSSYEVVVDGLTEELASIPVSEADDALGVDLVNGGGAILTGSGGTALGAARSLVFRNTTGAAISSSYVRVQSAADGCTTTCTANAQYRIRFRDTTLLAPRFNNSGTQVTVLILQNGGPASAAYAVRYWSSAGALLTSSTGTLAARGSTVISTAGVVPGQSGTITVDHAGRYGDITGKAVALEPATGYSFDTPLVAKVY